MYSKSLLKFIGGVIRPVAKVDKNTKNNSKGQFARLVVYIDLGKPLVSKINIDRRIQRLEYEALPMVFFDYGQFGHKRDNCCFKSNKEGSQEVEEEQLLSRKAEMQQRVEEEQFGLWMLVEFKNKRKT
ncbi:hypothetical protein PVK06_039852 [Gossypium arboreum]|uniref:Uncharacterized protein n=1 Tax=Gossypium arboreum TaxID=29729 RepID=A0ABR0N3Z4_GOSAR|nr:hypothetical protein PVK06_039852 [Gossypium arboreum]